MDFNFVRQPEQYFRFFDPYEQPKEIIQSIDNDNEQVALVTLEEAVEPLVNFVPQVQEMVKLAKEKCQQSKADLSIDESASIMLYTIEWQPKEDSFYYIFNRKLSSDDLTDRQPWMFYYKLFSTALSKLPRSSHRILYRKIQPNTNNNFFKNQRFFWCNYISCTSSIGFFEQEKSSPYLTVFIIHSEHGIDISNHSFYSIKHDILLLPGQQYQVVSSRTSNNGLCLITLKEIPIESIPTTTISDEEKKTFHSFIRLKRTKKNDKYPEINLRNQKLTDDHMDIIVRYAIQKKKCLWLSLQNNQITSTGLVILANGLEKNQSLESLYLSHNYLTDFGIECLAKILANEYSNLTFLSLNHNCIKDEGARCLANMLKKNRILTDLWLSYNKIGNDGAQALAQVLAVQNTTLIQLYLNGNMAINDSSICSLTQMLILNTRLDTIWLQDCSFTQEGKENLEKTIGYREDLDLYI